MSVAPLSTAAVLAASFAYGAALFGVAWWADRRAAAGRSVIANPWIYALSLSVYCTAWTYFGSVGRATQPGYWFLPIYLGPTLAMLLAWVVLRKMVRIARVHRITSIADFIASRYGKSGGLAGLVTVMALFGVIPYVALQLKAVSNAIGQLTGQSLQAGGGAWWADGTLLVAIVMAAFTVAFGTRHLDITERHEGMVAAVAAESMVKLLAFLAVGVYVCWWLYDGPQALLDQARAVPDVARVLEPQPGFAASQWFALTALAMLAVVLLPRQFQLMVVENVDEAHLKRAAWVFPAYLLLINLFVVPIAVGGLLWFRGQPNVNPELFVLSLPMAGGASALALLAFIGGLSAATGMVIVETIAVATMVSNDLVLPAMLRGAGRSVARGEAPALMGQRLLAVRRVVIVVLMLMGYTYFRVAGEAYALVSIGLISFAAVAQFAPALLGGIYWRGGTRNGAIAGLVTGGAAWAYMLMLPSVAKSGWLDATFLQQGPFGWTLLRPEQFLGVTGMDPLTHALFWSLLGNVAAYVGVSLARPPTALETRQAVAFVDVYSGGAQPTMFWRGRARFADLKGLLARFLGDAAAERLMRPQARRLGLAEGDPNALADAQLVHFTEKQLSGAVGGASARVMVASVAEEERLEVDDVLRIVEEASELRHVNEQLKSLDKLKDDFMSSVTHELRTPLTSIRALAELMHDDEEMAPEQRGEFLGIIVSESERLGRLVNQVLDMAKIESGNAEWRNSEIDLRVLVKHAVQSTQELARQRGASLSFAMPQTIRPLHADRDRLLQVLLNLLSNAMKFVPAEGGQVSLTLVEVPGGLRFIVRDNGAGVPPAQRGVIFEKFRQGGDENNRPQGTGLGLPISRQIIEHYGGRLWLDDDGGRPGACFIAELPWVSPQASDDASSTPTATPAPPTARPLSPSPATHAPQEPAP